MNDTRGNETMRFVSWNLNWAASKDERARQLELIDEFAPHVLVLQEMKDTTLRPIRERFDWCVFALGPRPDDRHWTSRVGTAVLGRGDAELVSQMAIAPTWFDLPDDLRWKANRFSRRALWAEVSWHGSEPFLVGSLHASPAAGDIGKHKPWFHAGVARWLADKAEPWLFGIDANTPAVDHPDREQVQWCWPRTADQPGEDELLGPEAPHPGRDLLVDWLEQNPAELERIRAERPAGPLAVSHRLPGGPVRYDHVWATPGFEVHSIDYLESSFAASDHTAIVVDLSMRNSTPRDS